MKNSGLIIVLILSGCGRHTSPPEWRAVSCLSQLEFRVLLFQNTYGVKVRLEATADGEADRPRTQAAVEAGCPRVV